MIYAKERPERPLWPRLPPWQDAPEPTPYALRGTQAKDRPKSRRVFRRKSKKMPGPTEVRPGRKEKARQGWACPKTGRGLAGKQCVIRFPRIPPRNTFLE